MEYGRFVRTDIEMDDGGVRAIMRFDAEAINDIAGKVDAEVFDLIAVERGYRKQDVDVAALRELADSLVQWVCIDGTANDVLKYAADRFVPNNAMPYLIRNGAVMQAIIASIGGSIRKAIDGAPKPAVLGADGKPIEVGQTVYDESGGIFHVCALARDGIETTCGYLSASSISHTPPDTQKRIDWDKGEEFEGYWGCDGCDCEACPSLIGNEKPCEHYGVANCAIAQDMDIARREQELHTRTTGGAK
ncbi:hypothetical protein [Eggerthella sinensis]|uniref:hypothetical protein n=1 Tax=Eggerthella sinensis TaxID=242230 RepID=UPI0013145B42|nr:hypothetical protein [Eggerthella sinensis]